jgi:hypothetical protein
MPFGVILSSFLLTTTIKHHLDQQNTPRANEIIENTYANNVMMSAKTTQEALNKYKNSQNI